MRTATYNALQEIQHERLRQESDEGWTPAHDDNEHQTGEIAMAAACYALGYAAPKLMGGELFKRLWPNDWEWKPDGALTSLGCRRRQLVKAGALIVAELERLERASTLTRPTINADINGPNRARTIQGSSTDAK